MRLLIFTFVCVSSINSNAFGSSPSPVPAKPTSASTTTSTTGSSTQFQCKNGDRVRSVFVSYADASSQVPCSVHYVKDTEAPNKEEIIFTSSSTVGFCDKKAAEFAEGLKKGGWNCTRN